MTSATALQGGSQGSLLFPATHRLRTRPSRQLLGKPVPNFQKTDEKDVSSSRKNAPIRATAQYEGKRFEPLGLGIFVEKNRRSRAFVLFHEVYPRDAAGGRARMAQFFSQKENSICWCQGGGRRRGEGKKLLEQFQGPRRAAFFLATDSFWMGALMSRARRFSNVIITASALCRA